MSVSEVPNCLEGNTISNRVAYSTKERMHSDRKHPLSLPAWKAVPDWLYISHFAMYCPPGSIRILGFIPAHPRFTRMYGVTNSIAFQAIPNSRNLYRIIFFVHYFHVISGASTNLRVFRVQKLSLRLCVFAF